MFRHDSAIQTPFARSGTAHRGARILQKLIQPKTVSALWEELPRKSETTRNAVHLDYDGFVLALDLLFLIGVVEFREGLLSRKNR